LSEEFDRSLRKLGESHKVQEVEPR
jgi:hypothetical protein